MGESTGEDATEQGPVTGGRMEDPEHRQEKEPRFGGNKKAGKVNCTPFVRLRVREGEERVSLRLLFLQSSIFWQQVSNLQNGRIEQSLPGSQGLSHRVSS